MYRAAYHHRVTVDPEYRAFLAEITRQYRKRRVASDPEYLDRTRAYQRAYYHRKRAEKAAAAAELAEQKPNRAET
jgi:hypothetical protein